MSESKQEVDDVAANAGFLRRYMTQHPETLVAYVRYYGGKGSEVVSAELRDIDSQGMTLGYKLASDETAHTLHVAFTPPLAGYAEVKPRMLAMKAEAEAGTRAVAITSVTIPGNTYPCALILLLIFYLAVPPSPAQVAELGGGQLVNALFEPSRALGAVLGTAGRVSVGGLVKTMCVVHGLESVYTAVLCWRYVRGWRVAAQYLLLTMMLGLPIWVGLERQAGLRT
ncbi:hypothetical protein BJ138DRAFT_1010402 [Hygrophoropsis aurantiaca]|uniref:Uncharacterized protein n=1 Tax=Hygrophoropsis aurantiaca TaxID=72124 RepID=A0ACB8A9A5_9AGAM|nr:hypothetical protein BJ138DRAFT_1010402 [Hygrophoropsis aurantiaca]